MDATMIDVYDREDMLGTLDVLGEMWAGLMMFRDVTTDQWTSMWKDPADVVRAELQLDELTTLADERPLDDGATNDHALSVATQLRIIFAGGKDAAYRRMNDAGLAKARLEEMAESWLDHTLTDRLWAQRRNVRREGLPLVVRSL